MSGISILKRPLAATLAVGEDAQRSSGAYSQTKFLKKTARGSVATVLRERYLRDDILCGSSACRVCGKAAAVKSAAAARAVGLDTAGSRKERSLPLSAEGVVNGNVEGRHYIVLDTNVLLHQMDLLESSLGPTSTSSRAPTPTFVDVIIPQTVLEEVRHRSLPLYNRLNALLKDDQRRWFVYWNIFSVHTAINKHENETANDRNDRAIRATVKWYRSHLSSTTGGHAGAVSLDAVLVSDDADNISRSRKDNLRAFSVRDYVAGMHNTERLSDLLTSRSAGDHGERRAALYPEHLPSTQVTAGIASGALHRGYFNANAHNYLEATVKVQGYAKPILLVGRDAQNRAVDGDIVAVEVLPEEQWRAQADKVIDAEEKLRNDDAEQSDDEEGNGVHDAPDEDEEAAEEALSAEAAKLERQPTGKVVGIVRRNWRSYVAHLDSSSVQESAINSLGALSVFATPVDRKVPRIRIRTSQVKALIGQKILVALDDWRSISRYPDGHFVRALGLTESKEAEQESLLLEHDVPYRPFSQAILDCLPAEGDSWKVPPKDMSHPAWRDRVDMRDNIICSIDPPGCQDIDDALHAKLLPNGNIEAGVHIADVSYFVKPENPMDAEAASRGVTVYLVDKRIDMLPHLLGTNLCSLRPHVERLAFSAVWELTPSAEIVNVRFHKSVIASKGAFTYEEAQIRKDDPSKTDDITASIRLLNSLAIKLKQKRMDAGALNLASPEVRIHLDSAESAGPIDVEQKEMRETNSLVEEFMLLANVSVAQKIFSTFPSTAVLRRHAPPPATNFETLRDVLKQRKNMDLDVSSSGALAASLDHCTDPSMPAFNTLVRIMATRCMLPAEYFCAGEVSRDAFAHYGLACPMYTHFTSPIRRYADVLAHRQLAAAIHYVPLHPTLHDKSHVDEILTTVNKRHRGAQMASRASVEFYVGLAIAKKNEEQGGKAVVGTGEVKLREEAFVIRAFRNGVAVFVSKYGLEGVITFKRDCDFDAASYQVSVPASISGLGKDVILGIFDKCTVEIGVEKDRSTQRGRVKMALV